MTIEFRTLGSLDLRAPDGRVVRSVLAQPKRLALLAYLAIDSAGGFARRDTLLGLFWPESDEERARAALRQAVHYLRRSLGAETLVNRSDDEIGIPPEFLRCDAVEFRAALARDDPETALELYQGDLLDGFFVSDAPEFERWLDAERRSLRTLAAGAAWRLSESAEEGDGDPDAARRWALRGVELAPWDESGVRRLLALLDRIGDRSGAVRAYETFAARLEAELELEPSPETTALVEKIRARDVPPAAAPGDAEEPPVAGSAPAGAASAAPGPNPAASSLRLVPWIAPAVLLVGTLLAVLGWSTLRSDDPTLDPRRVVVLPFENRTGEPELDVVGSMTADWIVQGLAGRGALEVVPVTAALSSALSSNATAASGVGLSSDPRPLARETGAGTAVSGSYYRQGDSIHVQARIFDVIRGRLISAIEPIGAPIGAPLEAVDQLRDRVLLALAPLSDVRGTHVRMAGSPPSYEAYQAYVTAFEHFVRFDMPEALRYFERAAAADSTFYMPAIAAAITHHNLGNIAATDSITLRVNRFRDDMAPLERATLDMVLGWLAGDHHAAWEASVRQAQIAPGSIGEFQVAEQARRLNRPRETIGVLTEMGAERGELRGWFIYWRELTDAHHMLGDHEGELAEARRARTHYPVSAAALRHEVMALAALGRVNEVEVGIAERMALGGREAPSPGALMADAALELKAHGYGDAAEALFEESIEWYRGRSAAWAPGTDERRNLARVLYDAGRWDEAEDLIRTLARESPDDLDLRGFLGVLAARAGDAPEREEIDQWLRDHDDPYLRGVNTLWRARMAAVRGDADRAVDLLRMAFGEGVSHGTAHHRMVDFEALRDHPGYQELMRPRG